MSDCKLVLIGGGGHCRSVIDSIRKAGEYTDVVITDRDELVNIEINGYKIVGSDDMLPQLYNNGFKNAFISIGSIKDTSIRRRACERLRSLYYSFPVVIDPSAVIAEDVIVGDGVFVGKNAIINSGSGISEFAVINTAAIIEHDCEIGEFSHVAVGAVICGGCIIENDVFVGANATIVQGVRIGANSVVGAGCTVLADVPANSFVTGVWKGRRE